METLSEFYSAGILGVLQGVTEFLPVSSSGHLVLFQQFLPVYGDAIWFDVVLHVGTLIPILWFYRRDLIEILRDVSSGKNAWASRPGTRLLGLLVVASIPTAFIGLVFQDVFESLFSNSGSLAFTFALTGCVLFLSGRFDQSERLGKPIQWQQALLLGFVQGCAIAPGISRSGVTISAALILGVSRDEAAKFSFLMSVPAILGAVILKGGEVESAALFGAPIFVGAFSALIAGYLALSLLVRLVKQGKFSVFCWYCWAIAIFSGCLAWM
jgi:undecaprenyl-diphosphatase